MPNPRQPLTREEFEMVLDRAAKTAPAGLSPEDFDAFVHEAAMREEAAKGASVAPGGANPRLDATGVLGGFLRGATGMVTGLANTVAHPIDTAGNLIRSQFGQFGKAYDDVKAGHYVEAGGHTAAGLLPLVGPAAAGIGERIAETGDVGEGIGEGALLAATASPSVTGPVMRGAGRGAKAFGRAIEVPARYAGAAEIFRGDPLGGGAIMATPSLARGMGSVLEAGGDSLAALRRRMGPTVSDAVDGLTGDAETAPRPAPNPDAPRPSIDVQNKWRQSSAKPYRAGSGVSGRYSEPVPDISIQSLEDAATGPGVRARLGSSELPPEFQILDDDVAPPSPTDRVRMQPVTPAEPTYAQFRPRGTDEVGPLGVSPDDLAMMRDLIDTGYNPRTAARVIGSPAGSIEALVRAMGRGSR